MQADKSMDINDATWAIMREISKLPYNVDDQQITRAKNQLKAQLLFAQDNPSGETANSCLPVMPDTYRVSSLGSIHFQNACHAI